jgi:hypothetical protein
MGDGGRGEIQSDVTVQICGDGWKMEGVVSFSLGSVPWSSTGFNALRHSPEQD